VRDMQKACAAAATLLLAAGAATGAELAAGCREIVKDAARLACYDAADRPEGSSALLATLEPQRVASAFAPPPEFLLRRQATTSTLDAQWRLLPDDADLFSVVPHRPLYVLPLFRANRVNSAPRLNWTEAVEPTTSDRTEAKFQFSFKTKIADDLFEGTDLWFGYTQSARWQAFDRKGSGAIRESEYEPELLLAVAIDYSLFGWHGRLLTFGLNHLSNGRDGPLSRSWNRAIAAAAFERGPWTLTTRYWARIDSHPQGYDNPGIENYFGRGDVVLERAVAGHRISAMLRHSLRGGANSRGAAGINWSFPIVANLNGYVEVFDGYAENLLDYDFRARYYGVGVTMRPW
jgi:phospholipase A1